MDANGKNGDGGTVMLILKVLGSLIGFVIAVVSAVAAYYSLINRIDNIARDTSEQGRTMQSIAASVKTLAEQALTEADLRTFCLQAQIANAKWVCPYATEPPQPAVRQRRVRTLSVAPPSAAANAAR